jgi:chromatin remodeling complex protein RSC6
MARKEKTTASATASAAAAAAAAAAASAAVTTSAVASLEMSDLVMSDTADSTANIVEESSVAASPDEQQPAAADAAIGEHPAMQLLTQMHDAHRELIDRAKVVDGMYKSLRKEMKRVCKKRRRTSGAPSNLMRPIELSAELSAFLGHGPGCKMTRGQVTSAINNYATTNSLKKQNNGRVIIVNPPLAALLGLEVGTEVQIFHVQTHLKARNHYLKTDVVA